MGTGLFHAVTRLMWRSGEHSPGLVGSRAQVSHPAKQVKRLDRVIIRFAGDSGDGMQLTGDRFTQESAVFGNDS